MSLVTFLIITYNSERWIAKCLDSVLNQTHKNLQILIIDDGSEDKTVDIIKQSTDNRIELHCKEHSGLSQSLNFAFDKIKGDYVGRLDSDDFSYKERISKQLKFIKENPSFGIIGTNFVLVDEAGIQMDKVRNPEMHKNLLNNYPDVAVSGSVLL